MRVLLVEDDKAVSDSIQLMLKTENFVVDCTELGEDGLEIGKIYDYDIIILDLMLPDIDGYEVLRRLRDARVETPILILSGLGELENKVKGLGFGAPREVLLGAFGPMIGPMIGPVIDAERAEMTPDRATTNGLGFVRLCLRRRRRGKSGNTSLDARVE